MGGSGAVMERGSGPTASSSPHRRVPVGIDGPVRLPLTAAECARLGRSEAVLELQRSAGNQAVARMLQRSGGSALPASSAAHRVLGARAAGVRVHRGGTAGLAVPDGSLAVTDGYDIAVASDAPAFDTLEGDLLLTHESVHVAQQTGDTSSDVLTHDAAETQADDAAVGALTRGTAPAVGRARGSQRFEASKHQGSLTLAMKNAGFSDKEQQEAYFANWCRDLSQFLVPTVDTIIGTQAATSLVQLLSQYKFGRAVSPAQLGMYDPTQHIDNPAGQINADLIQKSGAPIAVAGRGAYQTPAADLSAANIAASFNVDASGVPAYIDKSKQYIKAEAAAALEQGRTAEGLAHVGNFSHTVEDLFAHSNWVEAAVGQMLDANPALLGPAVAKQVAERRAKGQPPVETYAAEVKGKGNKMRPVLMTGTFSGGAAGHDTMISIKSELQNMVAEASPFKDKQSSQKYWVLGLEILDHIDKAGQKRELGPIFAAHIEQIMANAGKALTGATGDLVGSARKVGDKVGLGDVAAAGARLLNWGANKAVEVGSEAWQAVLKDAVVTATNFFGQHVSLAKIATYVQHGEEQLEKGWHYLKEAVKKLPEAVRNLILPQLAKAEKAFKDALNKMLTAAWNKGVQTLMDAVDGAMKKIDPAESPVYRKLEVMKFEELPKLRQKLIDIIREVAPINGKPVLDALLAIDQIKDSRERAAAMLQFVAKPDLADLLESMHGADKNALMGVTGDLSETAERIKQLDNLPDWAKAGASHSQLAKDHADSPMFGLAFKLANDADSRIIGLVKRYWDEHRQKGPAPDLAGGFTKTPPKEDEFELGIDKDAMDKDRQNNFLKRRDEAEGILALGHGEKLPGKELVEVGRKLWDIQVAVAKDVPAVGKALDELVALLNKNSTGELILKQATVVRHLAKQYLETKADKDLQTQLDKIPPAVDSIRALLAKRTEGHCHGAETADEHMNHQGMCGSNEPPEKHEAHAGVCEPGESVDKHRKHAGTACKGETLSEHKAHAGAPCPGETDEQHLRHAHKDDASRTEAHFNEQIGMLDKHRGKGKREEISSKASAADERVAAAKSTKDKLDATIDQIFGHPYDTTWWHAPVQSYIKAHAEILAQGVLDRNSGKAHSHGH